MPWTVFQVSKSGYTPLGCAAQSGRDASVAFLFAAGASDKAIWSRRGISSPWKAVEHGHGNIVRMLVDAGMDVIGGGSMAILGAMCHALERRRASILEMLLGVEGEARKKYWGSTTSGKYPDSSPRCHVRVAHHGACLSRGRC